MPTSVTPRGISPWLWVAMITLLPLLLGLALLTWQAERTLELQSQREADSALQRITVMIDNAARAAKALVPLAGRECADITLALREQVTVNPYVRSTTLVTQGRLYCSSLYGPFHEAFSLDGYADGRLRLFAADTITPGRALLVYRETNQTGSALATIDGLHLADVLATVEGGPQVLLQVGPAWMNRQGVVGGGEPPVFSAGHAAVASERYPLQVLAGFDEPSSWRGLLGQYPTLLLLAALGLGAGACCYWFQGRAGSQRLELQRALAAGEFIPFFQPVVASNDGSCTGVEVLMRWQHPREGLVRPDLFIPYAEASGLIVPMTRSLIQQTAEALGPLASSLPEGFHVGINIAAAHCNEPSLVTDCQAFLGAFPIGRIQLVLELTERELVSPGAQTLALFATLRGMGVKIALDDFGTGHSSLSYLHQFSVDYLKIDHSFVAMIGTQALGRHIVDSIIELCQKLGLDVVAEGVETLEQQHYLAGRGVAYLQGYLFARPMPAQQLREHLQATAARVARVPLASAAELG